MMTDGTLRRVENGVAARRIDFRGVLGAAHTLVGFLIRDDAPGVIEITVRRADGASVGKGRLYPRGFDRYVGPLAVADITYEAVASPVDVGVKRHWDITLHKGVGT